MSNIVANVTTLKLKNGTPVFLMEMIFHPKILTATMAIISDRVFPTWVIIFSLPELTKREM